MIIAALLLHYYDPIPPTKLHTYSSTSNVTVLGVFPLKIKYLIINSWYSSSCQDPSNFQYCLLLSLNDFVVSCLRLQTPTDCIPHSYYMYANYFNILLWCWGAYGGTPYTATQVQVRVDFKENWGGVEPERFCNVMIEATNPHRLHPTSKSYVYKVFQHIAKLWMGIWVLPYYTLLLLCQVGEDFRKIRVRLSPSDVVMSWLRLQNHLECITHP